MPVSSFTEHWIKPDALTINLNHFGDPDYLQVSVLAGAVVMAFKQDVIGYNATHNYRTWPLEAANTYLETTSAYNVYARLTRSEVNARALVVYDTVLRDIEGREITYAEDGSEVLGNANLDYFFVFLGQISESVNSGGGSVLREWTKVLTTGNLDTNQQRNDTTGLLDLMFRPHYDNPLDPTEITWIEALTHLGVAGGITMYVNGGKLDIPSIYAGLPIDGKTIYWENGILKAVGSSGGGGVADSVAWANVYGKPSWITDAKPIYTYSEIQGTPDLTKYAMKTDIPSLSGYATEQWVIGKNYVNSTSLANELKKYVSIDNDESINGLKNFKKGLQIDGLGISKSQDDVIYLDANLVVRGGITMYADNTVDIPSIIDSLPVASTTNKGIASFDGEYFSVSNGKVTLLEENVGLNEAELAAYLSNNKYATQSWVQSLGYATTSDLDSRINSLVNGAPAAYDTLKEIADVLAGNVDSIGDIITTLGTKWTQDNAKIANWDAAYSWGNHASVGYALKSYVDTEFAKYVTLATAQTISGEKNFTGGLKVNGSPIVYDATNKYWKLEGDLLVTGGVTMYGNEGTYTPSTIMDAISVDGTTISKDGGVLKVIGGTGGGLDITALQNYLTQNSYLNVTGGDNRYLKLGGGALSGIAGNILDINSSSTIETAIRFLNSGVSKGWIGYHNSNGIYIYNTKSSCYLSVKDDGSLYYSKGTIWHSGNLTASSLGLGNVTNLAASGYLTALSSNTTNAVSITVGGTTKNITAATMKSSLGLGSNAYTSTSYLPSASYTASDVLAKLKNVDGSGSGLDADMLDGKHLSDILASNVASATRSRYIETQAVDGSWYNERYRMYAVWINSTTLKLKTEGDYPVLTDMTNKLQTARTLWGQSFDGTGNVSGVLTLPLNNQVQWADSGGAMIYATSSKRVIIDGNVGIGTTNPEQKLHVDYGNIYVTNGSGWLLQTLATGKVGAAMCNSEGYGIAVNSIRTSSDYYLLALGTGSTNGASNTTTIRFIVRNNGNVGIGTAIPYYKLHVEGTMYGDLKMKTPRTIWGQSFDGTNNISGDINLGNSRFIIGKTTDGVDVGLLGFAATNILSLGYGSSSKEYATYIYGNTGNIRYGKDAGTALSWTETGNVGVGLTTPTQKFHVLGNSGWTSYIESSNSLVALAENSGYGCFIGSKSTSSSVYLLSVYYGQSTLGSGGNCALYVRADGNISMGKVNPSHKLDILNSVSADYDFHVYNSSTQCSIFIGKAGLWYGSPLTTGSIFRVAAGCKYDGGGGYAVFTVSAEGNVLSKGGMTMYSQRSLKNIQDERGLSLQEMQIIKPTRYTWKDGRDNRLHFGGIADDIQQVLPEVVYKTSDGILTMDYGNAAFAIASSLIKPVVDHEKRIVMLERENELLKQEVERLKSA